MASGTEALTQIEILQIEALAKAADHIREAINELENN